jgi:hypothetical protein
MAHINQLPAETAVTIRNMDTVTAGMRELAVGWPADDGVAVFNRVYLSVTEEIGRRIEAGAFSDPYAATVLDVRFAERYLRAVAVEEGRDPYGGGPDPSWHRPPACWRPLFRYRRHPGVRPLQFALCGVNAHVGHDLALAVVDTCRELDCSPEELESTFERVGEVLTRLEERIREEVMPGPDLLEVADPLTHVVGCWSLDRARDGAWLTARSLWALRGLPELAQEFTRRLDSTVGLAGRLLLTPLR